MQSSLQRLKYALGQDVYNQVLEVLAGETVYFPTGGSKAEKQQRNKRIKQDYYNGLSYKELAHKYGLCLTQIAEIMSSK